MVKSKADWEANLKEFEKMLADNKTNIATAEKNIEDIEFFMAALQEKIKSFG